MTRQMPILFGLYDVQYFYNQNQLTFLDNEKINENKRCMNLYLCIYKNVIRKEINKASN